MLSCKKANINDLQLYFTWANDLTVREQSFNSEEIVFENHKEWFESKLEDKLCLMLIFVNENNENVGQVRIEKRGENNALVGISIDSKHRGKSYAKEMLQIATDYFFELNPHYVIDAYIKATNLSSKYAFEKAGFEFKEMIMYCNNNSFHYIKRN